MLEAALALCRSVSSSALVSGGALSGPSRGQGVLWGKANRNALEERVLKRERGGSKVPSLKAPGENTWTCRVAVLNTTACLSSGALGYNRMPDYKEHSEGHLVSGQAVH